MFNHNFFITLIDLYSDNISKSDSSFSFISDSIVSSCGEILKCLYVNDIISEIYTCPIVSLDDGFYRLDYEITPKRYNLKYLKAQIDILFYMIHYIDSNTIWKDLIVYDEFYAPLYQDFIEKYDLRNVTYKYRFVNQIKRCYKLNTIEKI